MGCHRAAGQTWTKGVDPPLRKVARRAARLSVVGRSVGDPLRLGVGALLGSGVGFRVGAAVVGARVVGGPVVGADVGESVAPGRLGDGVVGVDVGPRVVMVVETLRGLGVFGAMLGLNVGVALVGADVGESVAPGRVDGVDVGVHSETHGYAFCSVAPQAVYMPFL